MICHSILLRILGPSPSERTWTVWTSSHGASEKNIGSKQASARGCMLRLCNSWRGPLETVVPISTSICWLLFWCLFPFVQVAAEVLAPNLEVILQHLMCAFGRYQVCILSFIFYLFINWNWCELIFYLIFFNYNYLQKKNLRIVYDAIGTLAEAVGGELNEVWS